MALSIPLSTEQTKLESGGKDVGAHRPDVACPVFYTKDKAQTNHCGQLQKKGGGGPGYTSFSQF